MGSHSCHLSHLLPPLFLMKAYSVSFSCLPLALLHKLSYPPGLGQKITPASLGRSSVALGKTLSAFLGPGILEPQAHSLTEKDTISKRTQLIRCLHCGSHSAHNFTVFVFFSPHHKWDTVFIWKVQGDWLLLPRSPVREVTEPRYEPRSIKIQNSLFVPRVTL